mmetsp:Transcript_77330/g.157444  ORF Transcript_77330/g.157444 Transcript_77330/m.157444 type:complete len:201 (+) Transcript_77330:1011-1613(+)
MPNCLCRSSCFRESLYETVHLKATSGLAIGLLLPINPPARGTMMSSRAKGQDQQLVGMSAWHHIVEQHLPGPALGTLGIFLSLNHQWIADFLACSLSKYLHYPVQLLHIWNTSLNQFSSQQFLPLCGSCHLARDLPRRSALQQPSDLAPGPDKKGVLAVASAIPHFLLHNSFSSAVRLNYPRDRSLFWNLDTPRKHRFQF